MTVETPIISGYARCAGVRCWDQASTIIADVMLCNSHKQGLRAAFEGLPVPILPEQEAAHVVYYITWRDVDHIKIGTSQNLRNRLRQLKKNGQRPRLLALEEGGHQLEAKRHRQFRDLRKPGSELFRPSQVLIDHIDNLKRHNPHWRGLANVGREWG